MPSEWPPEDGNAFQRLCRTVHLNPNDATWEDIAMAVERLVAKEDCAHVEHGDPVG